MLAVYFRCKIRHGTGTIGVLGRKAWVALGAVGGCDGDGASRREARRLGAVACDFQHFHGPGRGWRALALCW